jgi:ABC-type transporter Mla maintaining outer membrane lipid asymmetry ATPase subunit MlaF
VTHHFEFARTVSDLIAVLVDGRIAEIGPAESIVRSARPEVQAFLVGQAR